ncbi:Uncharacterised protein [Mycoplasmopsis maculosa]|uniref:Lipoprotein n=1 Tax=Mycoplasmopsis maculosa TaxID=114885 RepID=A0A449B452_9BACT|nr:hypothetical protein [Mycoplasmopsis maculosa]VEU75383.1 Uncharacterised protein [Mycoplasmopsis maculosa]
MNRKKKNKIWFLGLGASLIGSVMPLTAISCWNWNNTDWARPNPKPEPTDNKREDNKSNSKPEEYTNIDKMRNEYSALWATSQTKMPEATYSKGYSADKLFGYALNLGAMEINNRVIDGDIFNQKLAELKDYVKSAIKDILDIDEKRNPHVKIIFGMQVPDGFLSSPGFFGTENGKSYEEKIRQNNSDAFSYEEYLSNYRLFSQRRIANNDKYFRDFKENDIKALNELNSDYWANFSLIEPLLKRARDAKMTLEFLEQYIIVIEALKKDLNRSDLPLKIQLTAETKNKIESLYNKTNLLMEPKNYFFLDLDGYKWLFDLPDFKANYDNGWKFNRLLKLINEFILPLTWLTKNYIPFWEDVKLEFRNELYTKYLYKQWDNSSAQYVGELIKQNKQEANDNLSKWLTKNSALNLKFKEIE